MVQTCRTRCRTLRHCSTCYFTLPKRFPCYFMRNVGMVFALLLLLLLLLSRELSLYYCNIPGTFPTWVSALSALRYAKPSMCTSFS